MSDKNGRESRDLNYLWGGAETDAPDQLGDANRDWSGCGCVVGGLLFLAFFMLGVASFVGGLISFFSVFFS